MILQSIDERVHAVNKPHKLLIMWFPVEEPWQYRVLDQLPPGVDVAQLEQARRMTPTERVEAMCRLVELGESIRRAKASRSGDPR